MLIQYLSHICVILRLVCRLCEFYWGIAWSWKFELNQTIGKSCVRFFSLSEFQSSVQSLSNNPIHAVRVLAAKALVPLVAQTEMKAMLQNLLDRLPSNADDGHQSYDQLHGTLLQISTLLHAIRWGPGFHVLYHSREFFLHQQNGNFSYINKMWQHILLDGKRTNFLKFVYQTHDIPVYQSSSASASA